MKGRRFLPLILTIAMLVMTAYRCFTLGGTGDYIALLLLLTLTMFLSFRAHKARSFALSTAAPTPSDVPAVTFSDVAANDEAMNSLRDLVDFIRFPEKYRKLGARIPRGVLLYGPPGTGKTLMARALAGEAKAPFFAVNGADFAEMYVGVGASRIRALFAKARKAGRAVVFIDEIDAVGKKRFNGSDERDQTLNALLSEMSGFRESGGVIVLAATNRVDTLDEALLRAGRFDRQIEVTLPSMQERVAILQKHVRNKPMAKNVALEQLAAQTALFSGARLEALVNEAAILAAKQGASEVTMENLDAAYETQLLGEKRTGLQVLKHERELTAAHEAGHALCSMLLLPEAELRRVSIIPSTRGAAGYSLSVQPEKLMMHRFELERHIAVALAGRAAEEMVYGKEYATTGAAGDIEKALSLAVRMASQWGMSPSGDKPFLCAQQSRDEAAEGWMARGYELSRKVLMENQQSFYRLQNELIQRETLTGEEAMAAVSPS